VRYINFAIFDQHLALGNDNFDKIGPQLPWNGTGIIYALPNRDWLQLPRNGIGYHETLYTLYQTVTFPKCHGLIERIIISDDLQ